MAVSQGLCTSFKQEILLGVHDFRKTSGDTFKIALYTSTATYTYTTTAYSSTNEITNTSGTAYVAGGLALTNGGTNKDTGTGATGTAFLDFEDAVWNSASFTANGAIIYNTTPSAQGESPPGTNNALTNPAVCILSLGGDKTVSAGTFTIQFPAFTVGAAIIRIA